MYADNGFGRRRSDGWVERRRYFKKLTDKPRGNELDNDNDDVKGEEKTKRN